MTMDEGATIRRLVAEDIAENGPPPPAMVLSDHFGHGFFAHCSICNRHVGIWTRNKAHAQLRADTHNITEHGPALGDSYAPVGGP